MANPLKEAVIKLRNCIDEGKGAESLEEANPWHDRLGRFPKEGRKNAIVYSLYGKRKYLTKRKGKKSGLGVFAKKQTAYKQQHRDVKGRFLTKLQKAANESLNDWLDNCIVDLNESGGYRVYVDAVVKGIMEKIPVGTGKDKVGRMIIDRKRQYSLIKKTIDDFYERDKSEKEAIAYFEPIISKYLNAMTEAM